MINKREKELATEIPEGLKNLKKLSSLETTIEDGKQIQDFAIRVLDIPPEKISLLATEADANYIIKHVRVGDEESKDKQFYEDAKDEEERNWWLNKPKGSVPEHLLPLIKSSFLFYAKGIRDELT